MIQLIGHDNYAVYRTGDEATDVQFVMNGSTLVTNHDEVGGTVEDVLRENILGHLAGMELTFKPLPEVGEQVDKDEIYNYNGVPVIAVQSHTRTIFDPEETPALFSFWRENTDELEWIPNEFVSVGWYRWHDGIKYECIQAHQTLGGWEPPLTPALWKLAEDEEEIPEWKHPTGTHDAYNIGDKVIFEGAVYESTINANVWSPAVYPAGWLYLYDI